MQGSFRIQLLLKLYLHVIRNHLSSTGSDALKNERREIALKLRRRMTLRAKKRLRRRRRRKQQNQIEKRCLSEFALILNPCLPY